VSTLLGLPVLGVLPAHDGVSSRFGKTLPNRAQRLIGDMSASKKAA